MLLFFSVKDVCVCVWIVWYKKSISSQLEYSMLLSTPHFGN